MSFALRDGLYSGVRASPQAAGAAIRTTQIAPSTATQSAPGAARGAALGNRENRAARKAAGLYPRAWVGPPRSRIAITTGLPPARPGNPRGGANPRSPPAVWSGGDQKTRRVSAAQPGSR